MTITEWNALKPDQKVRGFKGTFSVVEVRHRGASRPAEIVLQGLAFKPTVTTQYERYERALDGGRS